MEDPNLGYRFLIVAFVILLNGFFAAAEVALVSVRQSRLKQLAAEGNAGARAALSLLSNPERLLSVVQVGVTLASLGLGWAGEATLFVIFDSWLGHLVTPATEGLFRGAAFVLSFLLMTYAHVVVGEVVPKNIAMERADHLAVIVAPVLLVFHRIASPFVYVIERSATVLSRMAGVKGATHAGGHSVEELKFIISGSGRQGYLEPFEESAISRLLDLQDHLVREIMVPRKEIISLSADASLDDILTGMNQHQLSRIPVYKKEREHIIGILHYKDLLTVWHDRRMAASGHRLVAPFDARFLMRKPFVVPETKPVNQLIDDFRKEHSHMAIVVDEFGSVVGLATLEDVMEQVFGEIEDEHDVHLPPVAQNSPIIELEGGITILDLETQYGIEVPGDAGFETLAGFLLFRLGHIPEPGGTVQHEGYRFTVEEVDGNRIAKVKIERIETEAADEDGDETSGDS